MHKEYSRMGNRRGITSALKKFPESSKHDEMDDKSILIHERGYLRTEAV